MQFLFGGFQFFVGRLHFLVGGLHFFISGLEFLVGGLLFFNAGLVTFFQVRKILLQFFGTSYFDRTGTPFTPTFGNWTGNVQKAHQQKFLVGLLTRQRPDAQADRRKATVTLKLYFPVQRRCFFAVCRTNGSAQLHFQPLTRHVDQVKAGLSRGRAKIFAGFAMDVEDIALGIGDDRCGCKVLHQDPAGECGKTGFLRLSHGFLIG